MIKTYFAEDLININDLKKKGFKEWIFYPNMLFNSTHKWWGSKSKRKSRHEGLDIALFRCNDGGIYSLEKGTKIPVIYDDTIIKIADDFLGESIFAWHDIFDNRGNQLFTIYGHTKPVDSLQTGKFMNKGSVIATISDKEKGKSTVPPYLHISITWIPESFPHEFLGWDEIGKNDSIILIDPLEVIRDKYSKIIGNVKSYMKSEMEI